MRENKDQDDRIVRYLLGDLSEPEQVAIEKEYFADPDKLDEVRLAESDLVDGYVRGRLRSRQREMFERHYLQSPRHRERVSFARTLLADSERFAESRTTRTTWWSRLPDPRGFLKLRTALAAALLVLTTLTAWLAIERRRLDEELRNTQGQLLAERGRDNELAGELTAKREEAARLKAELDRLQSESQTPALPPDRDAARSFITVFLSPMLVRGGGGPQEVKIRGKTGAVRFQMKVDTARGRTFEAAIRTVEGRQVWQQPVVRPRKTGSNDVIAVDVPADKLAPGDYFFTISTIAVSTGPGGQVEELERAFFRIVP
jgi:hypothetical protein